MKAVLIAALALVPSASANSYVRSFMQTGLTAEPAGSYQVRQPDKIPPAHHTTRHEPRATHLAPRILHASHRTLRGPAPHRIAPCRIAPCRTAPQLRA